MIPLLEVCVIMSVSLTIQHKLTMCDLHIDYGGYISAGHVLPGVDLMSTDFVKFINLTSYTSSLFT
jgi:hypothetical protein